MAYVEIATKMRDLPLGLKTTQLKAYDSSRQALAEIVRARLASERSRLSSGGQAELDRRVVDAVADVHGKFAKVGDIYFEKLSGSDDVQPEYFNAFVLVTMPKERMADVFESLGRRLAAAQDPALRHLGQSLLSEAKGGGVSH